MSSKPIYLFPASTLPLTTSNIIQLLRSPVCSANEDPTLNVQAIFGVPYASVDRLSLSLPLRFPCPPPFAPITPFRPREPFSPHHAHTSLLPSIRYKLLAESEEGIRILASMKLCLFGGSPCPDELGDKLVAAGVRLVGHYGLTELGQVRLCCLIAYFGRDIVEGLIRLLLLPQLMTSFRDFESDGDWLWLRASGPHAHPLLKQYISFVDQGDGKHELVMKPGWPTAVVSNQADGGFATKDLFIKVSRA